MCPRDVVSEDQERQGRRKTGSRKRKNLHTCKRITPNQPLAKRKTGGGMDYGWEKDGVAWDNAQVGGKRGRKQHN